MATTGRKRINMTDSFKPVSAARVKSAISVMNDIIDHNRRINPFAFNETLFGAIVWMESYIAATKNKHISQQ
jgi:hypothetical protein